MSERQPTTETGTYLYTHAHQWVEVGAKLWPAGTWHPVFVCATCGDVICDLRVTLHVTDRKDKRKRAKS